VANTSTTLDIAKSGGKEQELGSKSSELVILSGIDATSCIDQIKIKPDIMGNHRWVQDNNF
jgi:hypothetical protein